MKKALVHDWLNDFGGAERCVESFTNIWDDFDVYSLIDFLSDKDREIILKGKKAQTSFIQNLPFAKKKYRNYLPLFPLAVEQFDLSEYEVILSSSHAVAKGVLTRPDQLHISYVYSPIRYAWDLHFQYLRESGLDKGLKGWLAKYFLHKIRLWDVSTAHRVDHYIAISHYIARRIEKIYGKKADVIYPPVDTSSFTIGDITENYYVTSSRMVPYKKIDLIVEAMSQTNHKLIVIGTGPDWEKIKAKAGKNVELLGYQSFENMKNIIQKSKAYIFAAEEDFGIAPIEAQACGIPVIAFGKGATLETIIGSCAGTKNVKESDTGIFFEEQSIPSLLNAVELFEQNSSKFNKVIIRQSALRFSKERFEKEFEDKVDLLYKEWKQ
ncbi:MAG: glycosyltransferase family 4 protein [Campylobacterales bacterium]|nr:glycosyltransferase family 4 protein [Campylobacterales bacterium]